MTKRDKAVFEKAFAKMEAKGYFKELRRKNKLSEMLVNVKEQNRHKEIDAGCPVGKEIL